MRLTQRPAVRAKRELRQQPVDDRDGERKLKHALQQGKHPRPMDCQTVKDQRKGNDARQSQHGGAHGDRIAR